MFKILPNTKEILKELPKTFKILQKVAATFAKSGHTELKQAAFSLSLSLSLSLSPIWLVSNIAFTMTLQMKRSVRALGGQLLLANVHTVNT